VEEDPRDDGSDPGFKEKIVTESNATEEKTPEKGRRMIHKTYSFNAYEMGISWEDGKVVYDNTQYDDGTTSFDRRIDNAIGLMHLLGMSPETLTKD
jgi:regulatory protein YycH of two-component signal transduction system YycFG